MLASVVLAVAIETFTLKSNVFHNSRTIHVLLPADYATSNRTYPVLYLNDGQMVFRPLAKQGIEIQSVAQPPIIVVGIDNGSMADNASKERDDRAIEFLPYPDVGFGPSHTYTPDPPNPRGKLYPSFLVDEVMPAIEKRYRVRKGSANTAVGGFSYGGVAALYAVIARPNVFGKLLLESTPLWIGANRRLLDDASKLDAWPARVYVGVGTAEGSDPEINAEGEKDIATLMTIIREKSPSTRIEFVREEGARHATSFWRRRLPHALEFLFTSPRRP